MKLYTLSILKCAVLILVLLSMPAVYTYAWDPNDDTDRLSQSSSNVFAPGYMNAAQQQAMEISRQANQSKSWWGKLVENIKNKVSNDIAEDTNTKATVTLQKKASSAQVTSTVTTTTTSTVTADNLSLIKGTGTANGTGSVTAGQQYLTTTVTNCSLAGNQYSNVAGAHSYYWEEFNGVRYIYAGTAGNQSQSLDVLKGALALARQYMDEGKAVGILVASGTYGTDAASTSLDLMPHLKFYGGYDADGKRDIVANRTIINQYVNMTDIHDTEINGFTLKTSRETQNIGLDRSYDLTIKNNQLINTRASGSAFKFLDNSNILIYNNDIQGAYAYWGWGNGYFGYTGPHSNIVLRDNKRSNTSGEFRWSNSPYVRSDTGGTTGPTTSTKDFTISSTTTSTAVTTDPKVYDLSLSKLNYDFNRYFAPTGAVNNPDNIGKILRAFLTDKNAADAIIGPGAETRLGQNALDEGAIKYALALTPNMVISNKPGDMEASYALLSIMKNPIEDQKLVLESIEALVMDVNKEVGSAVSPEVQKAEEELLKVVAGVLLAQGVPDLFKEEDISNIKGMFKDLGQSKDKILFDYKQSVKPYYSSVVKELAANIAVLQVKGILSKKITEEEFRKFEPREIDKIINDIRKNNDKSFEMEYILQQEGKYRTAYLDPSNKMLEARMTAMMKNLPERSTVY